jgi:fucose permease
MVLLLVLIYIAFISLGLPDAILGSAWPVMHKELGVAISSAGIISFIISFGTIISSLFSGTIVRILKPWKVIVISVFMTSLALLGFSFSKELYQFCLLAVPLGLGAGSIDACLNNYVSNHYKSIHMNWLHAFWGIGAFTGPLILSFFVLNGNSWRSAYLTVFIIQFTLGFLLIFSRKLFNSGNKKSNDETIVTKVLSNREVIKFKGIKYSLFAFLCYCGYEASVGLWTSSYLVSEKGLSDGISAIGTSLFYLGITGGRIISGVLSLKVNYQKLIRSGCVISIVGVVLVLILPTYYSIIGVVLIGLGAAPFYPQMIHQTPRRFSKEGSLSATGLQMAFAYIGTTCIPPLIGVLLKVISFSIFPSLILTLEILVFIFCEIVHKLTKNNILEENII